MIIRPIRFVSELFVFLLEAAFVYGVIILAMIAFAIYLFAPFYHTDVVTVIEYVPVPIIETVEKVVEPVLECLRIDGCAINFAADTLEEYCPDCIIRR